MDSILLTSTRQVLDLNYFEFVFSSIFLYSSLYIVEREKNKDSLPSYGYSWKNKGKIRVANF